jgi:pimeloyl-ACP methyl ester carboxylesterase
MECKIRGGVRLAYSEAGAGGPPLLLVHGMRCNYTHMLPQMGYFMRRHRVVNVDLRGHGASDKPESSYSNEEINEDLVWLCGELGIEKPVAIGHSFGGSTLLHLAVARPDFLGGLVVLDSGIRTAASRMAELGQTPVMTPEEGRAFLTARLFSPDDPADLRDRIIGEMDDMPPHVSKGCGQTVLTFDAADAAEKCTVPSLFLLADRPFTDRETLDRLGPNWRIGQVVGAGHFIHMVAPDQVNAMIERFLELLKFAA